MSFVTIKSGLPTIEIEISTAAPLSASPSWTSIVTDVRSIDGISIKRGRTDELQRYNPGSFSCVFNNRGRKYDPDYASSPLNGYLTPNRRIRVRAQYNSITYILFDGFVDQWQQEYPHLGKDVRTRITATDAFKLLAHTRLPYSPYSEAVQANSPNVWYRFADSGNPTVIYDSSGNGNHGTYNYTGSPDIEFVTGLIAAAGGGTAVRQGSSIDTQMSMLGATTVSMSGTPDIACEFWFDTTDVTGGVIAAWMNNSVAAVIGISAGRLYFHPTGTTAYRSTANTYNDGERHYARLRWTSGAVGWVIDGVSDAGTSTAVSALDVIGTHNLANGQLVVGQGSSGWQANNASTGDFIGTLDELALYSPAIDITTSQAHYAAGTTPFAGDTSGTRVGRILDSADWLAAARDIDTGTATLQAVDSYHGEYALDLLQQTWEAERGQMYMGVDGVMSGDDEFVFVWRGRTAATSATRSTVSQGTFTNDGTDYIDITTDPGSETFLYNDVQMERRNGLIQRAEDQTSIDAYTRHTFSLTGLELETDAQVLTLVTTFLAAHKDPTTRILGLVVRPSTDPTVLFPHALGREIGDLITASITPAGLGSAISKSVIITGVEHTFRNALWETTWRLCEVDAL